jgi:flagellar hook-associated protein 2
MSTGNGIFTGSSTYASDFQQIIERSVAIASLPLRQLGNQKNALLSQSTELSTVESKFSALQTAIDNLVKATGAGSFGAAASDPTIAQVHIGDTSFVGDVTLEIDSLGAHTNTLSLDTLPHVTNPFTQSITTAAALTMTIGASTYAIPPGTGSLASLVEAINSSSAPVRATIINLGSGATPDYRLSLQSTNLADVAIQLNDGSQDLLSTLVSGSPATYRINGQPSVPISSDSRTVTISPGQTVDLLKTGTTDNTVSRSAGSIGDALSAFVTAFNAAVDELDANRGGAGALSGQSLVFTLSQSLRKLTGFSGSGAISSLNGLGVTFNKEGKLQFEQAAFTNAAQDVNAVLDFFGDPAQGGFLKLANDTLNTVDGPSGALPNAILDIKDQITNQNKRIDDAQSRIDLLRENLTAKIAAADALIASLQQQVIFFNGLFSAINNANKQL